MKFHLGILSLAMVVLPKVVLAQAITYSGRLTDGTGWGQSTQVQMVVRLDDSESAGSLLWSSPPMTVSVVDGFFSVMLSQGTGPDGNPQGAFRHGRPLVSHENPIVGCSRSRHDSGGWLMGWTECWRRKSDVVRGDAE